MTILLDGKKLREKKYILFLKRVKRLKQKGIIPHLVVVQVGSKHASNIYIKHKQVACEKIGIKFTKISFSETITYLDLKQKVNELNNDKFVHGILIQLPLPSHLAKEAISTLVNPKKDADGIHPYNQGVNLTQEKVFSTTPCTPKGIMELFSEYNIKLEGKNAVILGRSNIVGRPMQYLLTHANATTSVIHSKTNAIALKNLLKNADIIIAATGAQDLFSPNDVKQGVVIVDVGIIRMDNGKLRGDILYKEFLGVASYITPVPGGVGPMTVTMLLDNVITLTEQTLIK